MARQRIPVVQKIISTFILISFLVINACSFGNGGTETGNPDVENIEMKTFSSNEELEGYIVDQYARSFLPDTVYNYSDITWDTDTDDGTTAPGAIADEGANSGGEKSDDFSNTNIQEEGVDESDKVKTDGSYLYVAGDQSVKIVDVRNPDAPTLLKTIKISGYTDSLYLSNNILIVLYTPEGGSGYGWPYIEENAMDDGKASDVSADEPAVAPDTAMIATDDVDVGFPYWINVNTEIGVLFIDVSDPSNPTTQSEKIIEGSLVSSRVTSGRLHIIQQFLPELPPIRYNYDSSKEDDDDVFASNLVLLENVSISDIVPQYKDVDSEGNKSSEKQLVQPENFYRPSENCGGTIVTITTFDLENLTTGIQSTGVVSDAHHIYASTEALYIASTRWSAYGYGEKNESTSEDYQTYLYKFGLKTETVEALGTGIVSGRVLNQFSMGEYEDVLRIATTSGATWSGDSTNNVYCLKTKEGKLEVIGRIEEIARGEQIYAARFIGERGYVVTFVQTDPLFTIDLSDPENPVIIGELHIPGYSDYIHPLGENHLLTIGKDATVYEGFAYYQGLQLSIFDISDFANPQLVHQEKIGSRGTESEALHNHKAFEYWSSKGLLAIPIRLYESETTSEPPYSYGTYKNSGLWVYEISTETGFSKLGEITTSVASPYYGYNDWTRGKFNGDHIFTVQKNSVQTVKYDSMTDLVKKLDLSE